MRKKHRFESFANSERYKTTLDRLDKGATFESFANSERYKTHVQKAEAICKFESFANSERYKTTDAVLLWFLRLRALLIQKDTKLVLLK